jgi:hypothetical protein
VAESEEVIEPDVEAVVELEEEDAVEAEAEEIPATKRKKKKISFV